jgi:hypothetical protein
VTAAVIGAIDQDVAHASSTHLAEGDLLLAAHLNASMTRSIAGWARFLTLIQSGDRPAR